MELDLEYTKYLALALTLIGFVCIALLLPQETIPINEINERHLGTKVKLSGKVIGLQIKNNNAFFKLENKGSINAVYFRPQYTQTRILEENSLIEARGTITKYKGSLQIQIEKVKKID